MMLPNSPIFHEELRRLLMIVTKIWVIEMVDMYPANEKIEIRTVGYKARKGVILKHEYRDNLSKYNFSEI